MDDPCCAQKVVTALQSVPTVTSVAAAFEKNQACLVASGPITEAALGTALTSAGYQLVSLAEVKVCPEGLRWYARERVLRSTPGRPPRGSTWSPSPMENAST
jgi:copper chaperone CopZ